jgi:uncharacterized protein YjdB
VKQKNEAQLALAINMKINVKSTFSRLGLVRTVSLHLTALALIFLSLPSSLQAQTLLHRYSFVSDASDSVGGAAWNGTIVAPNGGGAATISNGLNLPGNATAGSGISGYVSLPNGIVAGDTSVTVECWVEPNSVNEWAEIWDFGTSGSLNFALIQDSALNGGAGGNMRVAFTPHGNEIDIGTPAELAADSSNYIAVTYDNSTLTANLYTNAILDGTATFPNTTYSPGSYGGTGGTTENSFGNDVYGDPQFGGTIYEVRIWNGVVSQRYIGASALLGPSVLVTNLTPTSISVTAGSGLVLTGTEQATVNVLLEATGTTNLLATGDATNWVSSDTNVLKVNGSGLISGVGLGTATVSAMVAGVKGTTGSITVTPQTLEHRYSFISDTSDSVGGTNWAGTVVPPTTGDPATISNGLFLPGEGTTANPSGYVSLPNGIVAGDSSVTVECWVTQNVQHTWGQIFSFGVAGGSANFGLIPVSGGSPVDMRAAFIPNGEGEEDINDTAGTPLGTNAEYYIAITYNNSTLVGDLYTNGAFDGTEIFANTSYSPGSYTTTEDVLGIDPYNGDDQFAGTIYELRIWNGAVTPLYVAASAAVGPSVLVTNTTVLAASVTVLTNMVGSQTQQAEVNGNFDQASGALLTSAVTNWTSSNTNILTVSGTGLITGISGGSATVSATVGGVTATSASIAVATTAPRITEQPSGATTAVSDSETLTVEALGGNLNYQWLVGGVPIAGATDSSLTLNNLTLGQSGNYSVEVYNSLGTNISNPAQLTIDTAILAHRYSFVSDASDSVGGPAWNGTIVAPNGGGAATISDGLNLPGNPTGGGITGYVSLPNGIVAGDDSVTVECWVEPNSINEWAEIWDFGSSGSLNFALIQDSPGPGNMRVAFTPHGNEIDIDAPTYLAADISNYIAVTYDNTTLTANLYTNAILDGTATFPDASYSPGTYGGPGGTTENMLGNDVYGDPQFGGTIYELRIWNGVISQRQIGASALLGAGVLVTNVTPTATSVTAGANVILSGTEQASVSVLLEQTGTTNVPATGDATNWISSDTNILTVNSSGLISGVGLGTATVSATVGGFSGTSSSITVTPQVLEHRYSFVSDASDSVGGSAWDGTVVPPSTGNPATINNGLSLPGTGTTQNPSGYVSLPSGIVAGDSSVTVECWVTQTSQRTWGQIWSFGVAGGSGNFGLIPFSGGSPVDLRIAFIPNGEGEVDVSDSSGTPLPTNAEYYISVTYDNSTRVGNLYTNGVFDGTTTFPNTSYSPGGYTTSEDVLGIDPYGGDDQFSGTIYELRIWNGAVSPLYVALSAAAGPTVVVTNLTPLSVALNVADTALSAGQSEQATVTGNFAVGSGVNVTGAATNWTSSNPSALAVSSSGLITAIASGSATVSATVDGVVATSESITVSGEVNLGITVSGTNIVLTWPGGKLLEAPTLLGPWTTNNAAVSPFTNSATLGNQFFKIQLP